VELVTGIFLWQLEFLFVLVVQSAFGKAMFGISTDTSFSLQISLLITLSSGSYQFRGMVACGLILKIENM
jgi:hypothetical protein